MPGIWPPDAGSWPGAKPPPSPQWSPHAQRPAAGHPSWPSANGGPDHQSRPQFARQARMRWVATPPRGVAEVFRVPEEPPYTGPPSYPVPPRWGFPNVLWRRPTAVPGTASARRAPAESLRVIGATTATLLVAFTVLAAVAGGLELWRYGLLVQSRDSALSSAAVMISNVTALSFAIAVSIVGSVAAVLAVVWLVIARGEAARRAEVTAPRGPWEVVVRACALWVALAVVFAVEQLFDIGRGVVVVAGPVLVIATIVAAVVLMAPVVVELEHMALGKDPDQRPRPSRQVLAWWAAWVVNAVCAAVTLWLRMGDGIQAEADAMLMTAVTNLAAALLAVLTAVLMRRMRLLLAPTVERKLRDLRVVTVRGAPDPPLRSVRPAGARR